VKIGRVAWITFVGALTSGAAVATLAGRPVPRAVAESQEPSVTDQRGKRFTFPTAATRVVPIAIPLLWTFMTVDGTDAHVVAANAVATAQSRDGIVDRVFPRVTSMSTSITRGGTFTPNIEALLALRPDAIFQWADRGNALIDVLDRATLRALGVKNTNSESDIEAWIRLSAAAAHRQSRADSLIRWMRSGNERYDSLTATIPRAQRPRVLVLTEFSRTITANGPHSYAATLVERAGGRTAATVDGAVSIEQVLAWNPDVILLTAFEARNPADLIADPRWATIAAARARRVYKLPLGVTRWGGYGPESPLALTWLAELLYPERFDFPLRVEMRDAYRALFHFEASDADLDRVLQFNDNRSSAHYSRFARASAH
jgi:iron complex transport system substrate-binding protein